MSPPGMFFDLFGTLLIFGDMGAAWRAWLAAFHASLIERGLSLGLPAFAEACDGFYSRPAPKDLREGETVFDRRIRSLCDELGLRVDGDHIRATADRAADAWMVYVTLDPEAPEVLETLRGRYQLALISNFDHPPYCRAVLERTGLASFFDAVVISGEEDVEKPHPAIFEKALMLTGCDRGRTSHVGDTDADVAGARNAGLTPVLIVRQDGNRSLEYDFWVEPGDRIRPAGLKDPGVLRIGSLGELPGLFGREETRP